MVVLFIFLAFGGLSGRTKVLELDAVGLGTFGTFSFDAPSKALRGLIMILFGVRFLI